MTVRQELSADLLKPTGPIMADWKTNNSTQAIVQNDADSFSTTRAVSLLSCPSLNSQNSCSRSNDASWSASFETADASACCCATAPSLNKMRCMHLAVHKWGLHGYTPPHDSKIGEAWGSWGRRNRSCSTPRWYSAASWVRVKRLSPVKMFQMQMRPP